MQVHLVDGTYELFRYYHAVPSHVTDAGEETAAVRGVLGSMLGLLEQGATHIGIATDHVIESFRNDLWPGYKSSAGIAPDLLSQFPLLEDALVAAGFVVWPMVEYEADDALAAAAAIAADDPRVDRVLICTPDKDLGQCVVDERVVQFDRRKDVVLDHDGIVAKFGIRPESIPDYLALVGDSADGFPGLAGWGAKSAAAVLARYPHLEDIPASLADWDDVGVRNGGRLLHTLLADFELALLFRRIATLERDAPTIETVDELHWTGPTDTFAAMAERIDAPSLVERAGKVAADRA
jgi:5'-3' exonuclease